MRLEDRVDGVGDQFGNHENNRFEEFLVKDILAGDVFWAGELISSPVPRDPDRRRRGSQLEMAAARLRACPGDTRAASGPLRHRPLPEQRKRGSCAPKTCARRWRGSSASEAASLPRTVDCKANSWARSEQLGKAIRFSPFPREKRHHKGGAAIDFELPSERHGTRTERA